MRECHALDGLRDRLRLGDVALEELAAGGDVGKQGFDDNGRAVRAPRFRQADDIAAMRLQDRAHSGASLLG